MHGPPDLRRASRYITPPHTHCSDLWGMGLTALMREREPRAATRFAPGARRRRRVARRAPRRPRLLVIAKYAFTSAEPAVAGAEEGCAAVAASEAPPPERYVLPDGQVLTSGASPAAQPLPIDFVSVGHARGAVRLRGLRHRWRGRGRRRVRRRGRRRWRVVGRGCMGTSAGGDQPRRQCARGLAARGDGARALRDRAATRTPRASAMRFRATCSRCGRRRLARGCASGRPTASTPRRTRVPRSWRAWRRSVASGSCARSSARLAPRWSIESGVASYNADGLRRATGGDTGGLVEWVWYSSYVLRARPGGFTRNSRHNIHSPARPGHFPDGAATATTSAPSPSTPQAQDYKLLQ